MKPWPDQEDKPGEVEWHVVLCCCVVLVRSHIFYLGFPDLAVRIASGPQLGACWSCRLSGDGCEGRQTLNRAPKYR